MKNLLLVITVLLLSTNLRAQNVDTGKIAKGKIVTPTFLRGGGLGWNNFLASNVRYPKKSYMNGVQGQVLIEMTVEEDGRLTNLKVLKSPADDLKDEALRVIALSPKWKPATQDGKPVKYNLKVPIDFTQAPPVKR